MWVCLGHFFIFQYIENSNGGGEVGSQQGNIFVSIHYLVSIWYLNVYLKITARDRKYSRIGKQSGKEMELTNHPFKKNAMSSFQLEYFFLNVYGIICGFGNYTLMSYLKNTSS